MKRFLVLGYGFVSYLLFFGSFAYAVGFLGNFLVPKSIDSGATASLTTALAVNSGLLAIFAIQHSVMARPAFKAWWTRFVAQPLERSTYVLLSSLTLILLYWQWQPMGNVVWNTDNATARIVIHAFFAAGWMLVFVSTCLISHFDLFGLRQVWLYFQGRDYEHLPFKTPGLYKHVRHPLYVGWITVFWATPTMTVSHLLFAMGCTAYILVAIRWEERDLQQYHQEYGEYREQVPMLLPRLVSKSRSSE